MNLRKRLTLLFTGTIDGPPLKKTEEVQMWLVLVFCFFVCFAFFAKILFF